MSIHSGMPGLKWGSQPTIADSTLGALVSSGIDLLRVSGVPDILGAPVSSGILWALVSMGNPGVPFSLGKKLLCIPVAVV